MAKRGNREGSIFQRADGRWCAVVSLGWQNGRRARKYVYGATQAEIVERLTVARKAAKDGVLVLDERQTVAQYLKHWLQHCARPKVRPSTFRRYSDIVRLHIEPELGPTRLSKLTPQQVQTFLNRKCGSASASRAKVGRPTPRGLSPRTVRHCHAVLRVALGQALRWGLLTRNVATLVDPPRTTHTEVQPFSPDEARRFLVAVEGNRLEALYTVALACGLRQGEALGLRWQDIDLDAGSLRVCHALQRVEGTLTLVEPKTARSRRTVALPTIVVKALRAHRARQLEERLLAGRRWQEAGFVFTSTIGTPLDARNVQDAFKAVLTSAELRPQRFHDLRHGAASLLLAQGVQPRGVMEILGHSQIGITLNLYSHVMPELLREAADKMDAVLAPR